MEKKLLLTFACLMFLGFSACEKFVQIAPPKNQAELSRIFENDQTAVAATTGLYTQLIASSLLFCNGGMTIYPALSADELVNVTSSTLTDSFRNNQLLADNTTIGSTFWSNPYKNIFHANAVIEGLQNSSQVTPKLKERLLAEMLYIRALHHFYLLNLFGNVPLINTTDYEKNGNMARVEASVIFLNLINDLLKAKLYLTNNTTEQNRVNKETVTALLARIYLYQGDWQNAATQASEVLNSGKYSLEPLVAVFLAGSKEALLSLARPGANTAEGTALIPSSATTRPAYVISDALNDAFENGDNRKTTWLKSNVVSGITYTHPFKYKIRTGTTVTENYVVQRLAEVYLISAEAKAQLNDLAGAITDIDRIRQRAGVPLIKATHPAIGKEALLKLIMKERQVELFCEWGHRWFDLKRMNKADEILGVVKAPTWKPDAVLYPIPLAELQKNPNLTQNSGYFN
ncbi:RagB/SusD family nutrient uptake outer membrane protein [Pedobacter chinensis]|uniref:RagB/SusD family nutrient uptake outer membrane protein n=1 Tax=Pedobacter chinensis TaxID=2282421 RepID=A0A369PPE5_9SPHI|nr:RagB/SusD family nutrient uptake outer membrane protein [Pedobacter chinensis]RDC54140.1 RagB/SusD family nutrient uptake outer membrane protein [Pedobacter chinensis]